MRQIFENLITHKPFLGSREIPQKNFGPISSAVYWIQTNKQTSKLNLYKDVKIYIWHQNPRSQNNIDLGIGPLSVWMHSGTLCTSIIIFTNASSIVIASRSGNWMAIKYLEKMLLI